MQITFLGTGTSQGIPLIACPCAVCTSTDPRDNRLRSSIMISHNERNIVIDTGPDFRQQMLRENVQTLEAVVYTHEHKDHIAGMDDVRAFNYIQRKKIPLYCNAQVAQALRREFAYAFSDYKYPGIPEVFIVPIELTLFEIAGVPFIPIEVTHLELPVLGFRVGDFTYITDANFISEKEKKKILGTRILVLNALRHDPHPSHFTLKEAIALAEELGAEQTWFTHISHQLGTHSEVQKHLPPGVALAYDGLKVVI